MKLQQLTLVWHPEVSKKIQALGMGSLLGLAQQASVNTSSSDDAESHSGEANAPLESIGLQVNAELVVLRFDLALSNTVQYSAKLSGATMELEMGLVSTQASPPLLVTSGSFSERSACDYRMPRWLRTVRFSRSRLMTAV